MPKYQVTEKRFIGGCLHGPGTGRDFYDTDTPFDKKSLPEGLVLINEGRPTASQRKGKSKSKATAPEVSKDQAAAEMNEATFLTEGESTVRTL